DIDIQHHGCWLKGRGSLHCSLLPVVEPRECCECAYAYDHGRATQPFIEVPGVRDHFCALPPKQQPTSDTEIDACPGEIAEAQMDDRLEPRCDCDAKHDPVERHHGHEYYRNGPHFPYPFYRYVPLGGVAAAPRSRLITTRLLGAVNLRL